MVLAHVLKKSFKEFIILTFFLIVKIIIPFLKVYRRIGFLIRYAYYKARLKHLGKNVYIYPNVVIHQPEKVVIGDNVVIAEFVHIWGGGGVEIGDDTIIAAGTIITSLTHDKYSLHNNKRYRDTLIKKPVKIGKNVWIGSGVIILPGVSIGDNSIIGAGAVVTKDVESNQIVAGVPAKVIGRIIHD